MKRKTVLILVNHEIVIYNFRKELVERLLEDGHRVIISSPVGRKIDKLVALGAEHDEVVMNRHGINPIEELKLLKYYNRIIKKYSPDIVFGYTIKPNIHGAMAANRYGIPFVANVTGLGTAVQNPGMTKNIVISLYKKAFKRVQTVFFQNKTNRQFFIDNNIAVQKHKLLPGSGVNLSTFQPLDYPKDNEKIKFVFISRIMKDKGIEEYLKASQYIKEKYPDTEFHVCGFLDGDYKNVIEDYQKRKIIRYHGMVNDVREVFQKTHCTVHPSYHEGLSNVLLESAASGRPVLASDIPGCNETFDDGISGYKFKSKSTESLIEAIEKFLQLSHEEKKQMGIRGREKVQKEFNRQIVVNKYLEEIELAKEREFAVEGK